MTATTTMAEACADIGSLSRDVNDNTGGGGHGRWLSLARVTAAMMLAEARADVGSTGLRDGDNDRISFARVKARTTMSWQHCRPALSHLLDGDEGGRAYDGFCSFD